MKSGIRIIAIEDSPFSRKKKECMLVGVVGRQDIIEGILSFNVEVDGSDSTDAILKAIKKSRFLDQIRLVALNGNTVAGMNIIDIVKLSMALKIPVIAITRKKPHPKDLKAAIRKAAPRNYTEKSRLLDKIGKSAEISKISGYYVQRVNANDADIRELVESSARLLRLAHIIASGISTGESKGRL